MDFRSLLHNPVVVLCAYWLLSSALQSMPEPSQESSAFYRWFYGFVHIAAANWHQVKGAINPPLLPLVK